MHKTKDLTVRIDDDETSANIDQAFRGEEVVFIKLFHMFGNVTILNGKTIS